MPNNRYQHITDAELLNQFYADHDNAWLGILLERYTLLLLGVCMKYLKNEEEAKDAVQHVFLKSITELQKYKVEYFKSWVYMVAKNHCLMKLRGKGRWHKEINETVMKTVDETVDKKEYVAHDHSLQQMELALEKLNPEQRQCVMLFYLEKKSYQEITEATGFTLLQVKSYIQNGKRNLKIMLERSHAHE